MNEQTVTFKEAAWGDDSYTYQVTMKSGSVYHAEPYEGWGGEYGLRCSSTGEDLEERYIVSIIRE